MAESIAENLFKEFTADGLSQDPQERMRLAAERIERLLTEEPRPVETTWLEFKSGYAKEGDWQTAWSELIGGFANTGGGVVIWGVYASREKGDIVDTVRNIQYVPNVNEFLTKLKQAAHTNTNPPLSGIQYFPIIADVEKGRGFIVCYIPQGHQKPYDSLNTKDRFYMRFDDETKRIGVETLRLLFHPSSKTEAVLEVNCVKKGPQNFLFRFTVTNIGKTSIVSPYISITAHEFSFWRPNNFDEAPIIHSLGSVLHPTMPAFVVLEGGMMPLLLRVEVSLFETNQYAKSIVFTFDSVRQTILHNGEHHENFSAPFVEAY